MSAKKIPDKNNFLEKFYAIETFLEGKIQPASKLKNKESAEADNPEKVISEYSSSDQKKKCSKCGATLNPEYSFCGSCGNVNESIPMEEKIPDELNSTVSIIQQNILKCPSCGISHNPDDVFCENCGNKLV